MTQPKRLVTDSMIGMQLPDAAVLSPLVTVVLGQNPSLFTGPGTNTYLIGSGKRPLLLDTGQGVDAYHALLDEACRSTRPTDAIEAIVLTHGHIDHIGGAKRIVDAHGCSRVHKKPWAERDPSNLPLVAVEDGETVEADGATLRAVWTPGHAWDHLCFYLEEEKALFTGDVVLGAGTTVIPDDGDLGDYLDSLRRLLTLDIAVIHPAHGPSIHEPYEKIRQYLAHRELREQQILAALREGAAQTAAIVRRIYTDVPEALHGAAAMSVRAHLRKLEREGVVDRDGEDWRLRSS